MRIIFESHSTSEDNEKWIASGHLNPPLSEKGREQAIELGKRYASWVPDIILCSDLKRSSETADLAFPHFPKIQSPFLREWNYGTYNGKSVEEVENLKHSHIHDPFPEGESLDSTVVKILDFLDLQLTIYQNILIIAHRSTFYALEHRYNRRSLESLIRAPWTWRPGWVYQGEKATC